MMSVRVNRRVLARAANAYVGSLVTHALRADFGLGIITEVVSPPILSLLEKPGRISVVVDDGRYDDIYGLYKVSWVGDPTRNSARSSGRIWNGRYFGACMFSNRSIDR